MDLWREGKPIPAAKTLLAGMADDAQLAFFGCVLEMFCLDLIPGETTEAIKGVIEAIRHWHLERMRQAFDRLRALQLAASDPVERRLISLAEKAAKAGHNLGSVEPKFDEAANLYFLSDAFELFAAMGLPREESAGRLLTLTNGAS